METLKGHDGRDVKHLNRLLVGAGPGNLTPRGAGLDPSLLSHLDPSFWEIMDSTADLLRQVSEPRMTLPFFFRRREWPGWRPCSLT